MIDKMQELRDKHAAELIKLEQELTIAASAPVTPKRAMVFKPIPWLIYEAATIGEALAIMNAAPIAPFDRTKAERGKFTRLWPWSIATADKKDNWQSISAPWAASIHVNQGTGFGPSASLRYFVRCGEVICAAHINLIGEYHRDAYPQWSARCIRRNEYSRARDNIVEWRANTLLAAQSSEHIKWGSGDIASASFEYLFSADYEDGGTEHATAMLLQLGTE